MSKISLSISSLVIITVVVAVAFYAQSQGVALLEPQGAVARYQTNLLVYATLLSLLALIPTFLITIFVIMRYRHKDQVVQRLRQTVSHELSLVWLALLLTIIGALVIVLFKSTPVIDPYRALDSDQQPLQVQVVALQWKWLFIYPEQGIATVNELVIPQGRPVSFAITADAPMSSFWIPKLGGMIYAMEGMVTKLNLVADTTGQFPGHNAEINGKGYADMNFTVKSVSSADFSQWVTDTYSQDPSGSLLDSASYADLAKPSIDHPVKRYASVEPALFGSVIMKFMDPAHHQSTTSHDQH